MKSKMFVDVTEIFRFNRTADEVTGVPRVVLEIAYELCRSGLATPVFYDHARKRVYSIPADSLTLEVMYDRQARTTALGESGKWSNPDKFQNPVQKGIQGAKNQINALRHRLTVPVGTHAAPLTTLDKPLLCIGAPTTSTFIVRYAAQGASVLVHDAIPLHQPFDKNAGMFRTYVEAHRNLERHRCRLIANSEHTRTDYLRAAERGLVPQPAHPIACTLLAHEFRNPPLPRTAPLPTDEPFLLTVGSLTGRKNGEIVFDALADLQSKAGSAAVPSLVIAGRNLDMQQRWAARFSSDPKYQPLASKIHWIEQPDHAILHQLYRQALAVLYPSLYEGFGLPVGEALWLGTPVLASNATSIPEVGGTLAQYFDPTDAQGLADLINRIHSDAEYRAETRDAIRDAKGTLRSWSTVADEMAALTLKGAA